MGPLCTPFRLGAVWTVGERAVAGQGLHRPPLHRGGPGGLENRGGEWAGERGCRATLCALKAAAPSLQALRHEARSRRSKVERPAVAAAPLPLPRRRHRQRHRLKCQPSPLACLQPPAPHEHVPTAATEQERRRLVQEAAELQEQLEAAQEQLAAAQAAAERGERQLKRECGAACRTAAMQAAQGTPQPLLPPAAVRRC